MSASRPRILVDDPLDGPAADAAEADLVAREHDAVDLRPVEPVRFVRRSFEGAHLPGVLLRGKKLCLPLALLAEQLVHLALRSVGRAQLRPLRLNGPTGLLD